MKSVYGCVLPQLFTESGALQPPHLESTELSLEHGTAFKSRYFTSAVSLPCGCAADIVGLCGSIIPQSVGNVDRIQDHGVSHIVHFTHGRAVHSRHGCRYRVPSPIQSARQSRAVNSRVSRWMESAALYTVSQLIERPSVMRVLRRVPNRLHLNFIWQPAPSIFSAYGSP